MKLNEKNHATSCIKIHQFPASSCNTNQIHGFSCKNLQISYDFNEKVEGFCMKLTENFVQVEASRLSDI
jgi:hypothetical protein